MTPAAASRWIESLAVLGMRFGLERMTRLLTRLGDPQLAAPAIHVVGTNGKSSTCRFAAAALGAAGVRSGAYLSPHVEGWHERIAVDGLALDPAAWASAVGAVRDAAGAIALPGDEVTQFEALTAAAFLAFAERGVGVMVIEAGLGGRWDATNVLPDDTVVVLTNVALEHTDLLGDTEAAIAAEKLAVAPDGSDRLVIGRMAPHAAAAVRAECRRRSLSAWWEGREVTVAAGRGSVTVTTPGGAYAPLRPPVAGGFQVHNLAVAVAAVERRLGRRPDGPALAAAIAAVRTPGRLEVVAGAPTVVMDGAHNPAGVAALVDALPSVLGDRRPVSVVSILRDKDAESMVAPIARASRHVVATRSSHPRARDPEDIARLARAGGSPAVCVEEPGRAVREACRLAGPDGAVLICGSLYLLSDVRVAVVANRSGAPGMLAAESAGNDR